MAMVPMRRANIASSFLSPQSFTINIRNVVKIVSNTPIHNSSPKRIFSPIAVPSTS